MPTLKVLTLLDKTLKATAHEHQKHIMYATQYYTLMDSESNSDASLSSFSIEDMKLIHNISDNW